MQHQHPAEAIEAQPVRRTFDLGLDRSVSPVRLAYAAAHVVTKRHGDQSAGALIRDQIDWEATMAFRRYLWTLGFGVAEAMDTAQRSILGWEAASELMDRTLVESRASSESWPEVIGGAGTDGLKSGNPPLPEIIDEYVRQAEFIQSRGGSVILLASNLLPRLFPDPASYIEVYTQVARQLRPPIFLHWLGEMFAADLAGYFPGDSFWRIMESNTDCIKGVKISLLDEQREVAIRNRLRRTGQIVLTGDDYHYTDLILGNGGRGGEPSLEVRGRKFLTGDFSHALLGVFDAIAPVAAKALEHLAKGNVDQYKKLMGATSPLGELLFEPPTQYYKAGVVFLAYLNGHQDHFKLLGDLQEMRAPEHYLKVARLAEECGVLTNPHEAQERLRRALY